jgi:hypothetical protein
MLAQGDNKHTATYRDTMIEDTSRASARRAAPSRAWGTTTCVTAALEASSALRAGTYWVAAGVLQWTFVNASSDSGDPEGP